MKKLRLIHEKEAAVQKHLASWADLAPFRAGAPPWMEELTFECRFAKRSIKGTDGLQVDGLATDGRSNYVVELKKGGKYDHAALAQVLYYAEKIPAQDLDLEPDCWTTDAPIVPVIVSPWHPMLRTAVSTLRKKEVSNDTVRLVEFVQLEVPGQKQRLFWFEEAYAPLADTDRRKPPVKVAHDGPWIHDRVTGVFYSVSTETESPADLPDAQPRWVIAPLGGTGKRRWLVWHGSMVNEGDYWLEMA